MTSAVFDFADIRSRMLGEDKPNSVTELNTILNDIPVVEWHTIDPVLLALDKSFGCDIDRIKLFWTNVAMHTITYPSHSRSVVSIDSAYSDGESS